MPIIRFMTIPVKQFPHAFLLFSFLSIQEFLSLHEMRPILRYLRENKTQTHRLRNALKSPKICGFILEHTLPESSFRTRSAI